VLTYLCCAVGGVVWCTMVGSCGSAAATHTVVPGKQNQHSFLHSDVSHMCTLPFSVGCRIVAVRIRDGAAVMLLLLGVCRCGWWHAAAG
jgi:hypothetical protein